MSVDPLKVPRGRQEFGAEIEAAEVDPWFLQQLHGALKLPLFSVPKPFETWMIDKVASSGFDVPISQIVGFSQFVVQPATPVVTSETTASVSWTDLATVGPTLTGLPDGQYLFLFGCLASNNTAGFAATTNLNVNGSNPANDNDTATSSTQTNMSITGVALRTLDASNNTVKMVYATNGGGTATYARHWLIALKYANI